MNLALLNQSYPRSWELRGRIDPTGDLQTIAIPTLPCTVGRSTQNNLVLTNPTISQNHARFDFCDEGLLVRDCGSTNGTFVNGVRLANDVVLHENDCLQFGTASFTVGRRAQDRTYATVGADVSLNALAHVEFARLIDDPAVQTYFQPIVNLTSIERVGFELLARSSLVGLQLPAEMFQIARERGRQVELSVAARQGGLAGAEAHGLTGQLFVNTHPDELFDAPSLLSDMKRLKAKHSRSEIVVEIHEASVTSFSELSELRRALWDLGIGLAFDDFGAGQSRLAELSGVKPDYIKFDRGLIDQIDEASSDRVTVLRSLVSMVRELGITPLAEGVETPGEAEACREFGFELAQGYLFGRPLPARDWTSVRVERKKTPRFNDLGGRR